MQGRPGSETTLLARVNQVLPNPRTASAFHLTVHGRHALPWRMRDLLHALRARVLWGGMSETHRCIVPGCPLKGSVMHCLTGHDSLLPPVARRGRTPEADWKVMTFGIAPKKMSRERAALIVAHRVLRLRKHEDHWSEIAREIVNTNL